MPDALKQLTERWFEEVWNKGNRAAIDEMFGPDCVLHDGAVDMAGPESFKVQYDQLRSMLSGIHIRPEVIIGEGNHVVARWVVTAKHRASGNDVEFTGMTLMRFEDGRPVEGWQNWDLHSLMEQTKGAPLRAAAHTAG